MNPSIVKRCLVGAVLAIAATLPGFQSLHTSVEGLKLIADYEGCRLQPYQCSAGVWTDGIGNTSGVVPGKTITERQAAQGLITNVLRVERALGTVAPWRLPPGMAPAAGPAIAFHARLPEDEEGPGPIIPVLDPDRLLAALGAPEVPTDPAGA